MKRAGRQFKYAAFISYHQSTDARLAVALREGLEQIARPWYRTRAFRIFHDSELATGPRLWEPIRSALDSSDYLILLASPSAAQSSWVNREVEYFLTQHDLDHVLLAVADGQLAWAGSDFDKSRTDCIPGTLYGRSVEEPKWTDLRFTRAAQDLSLRDRDFADKVLELAAPLHGMEKDAIGGQDHRRRRTRKRVIRGVVAAVATLGLAAAGAVVVAKQQRDIAQDSQQGSLVSGLITRADGAREDGNVHLAARLGVAAMTLRDSPQTRGALVRIIAGSPIAANLTDAGSVTSFAYSPDGQSLVTAGLESGVAVWDVSQLAHPVRVAKLPIDSGDKMATVAWSPDANTVVTTRVAGPALIWDLHDRTRPTRIGELLPTPDDRTAEAVAFSPDGHTLAVLSQSGVTLWDFSAPTRPAPLVALPHIDRDNWNVVAFSVDGEALLTAGSRLVWWDVRDRTHPQQLVTREGAGTTTAAAYSPDKRTMATVNELYNISVWDVTDPAEPFLIERLFDAYPAASNILPILSVSFSADGRVLATGSPTADVTLWDVSLLSKRDTLGEHYVTGSIVIPRLGQPLRGHTGPVIAVAFSPDGRALATGGIDPTAILWEVDRRSSPTRISGVTVGPGPRGPHAVLSRDGQTLATVGKDGVELWDVSDPGKLRQLGTPLPEVGAGTAFMASFSPDGKLLAVVTGASVVLWNVSDRRHPTHLDQPLVAGTEADSLTLASFSSDPRYLVTRYGDALALWDVSDPQHPAKVRELDAVGHQPADLAPFVWPGNIEIRGDDTGLTLWDVTDRTKPVQFGDLLPPAVNTDWTSARISPDQLTLVAGSTDHTFTLWDLTDRNRPARLNTSTVSDDWSVTSVQFTADSRTLVTLTDDGHVSLWSLSPLKDLRDHLVERACAVAGRGLNEQEWATYVAGEPFRKTC